jgi:hypothetical protein
MVQGGQRILNVGDGSGSPNPLRRKNDRGSVPSVSVLFYESSLQKPVTKLLEMFGVFVRLVIIGYHVMRSMPSNEVLASTVAADTKEASIRNATQSIGVSATTTGRLQAWPVKGADHWGDFTAGSDDSPASEQMRV